MMYPEVGSRVHFKMKIYNKAAVLEKFNSRLKFHKYLVPSVKKGQERIVYRPNVNQQPGYAKPNTPPSNRSI